MIKAELLDILNKYEKQIISSDQGNVYYNKISDLLKSFPEDYDLSFTLDNKYIINKNDLDNYLKNGLGLINDKIFFIYIIIDNLLTFNKNNINKVEKELDKKKNKLIKKNKHLNVIFWIILSISIIIFVFSIIILVLFFINKEKYDGMFTIAGILDFSCGLFFFIYEITSDKFHNDVEIESLDGISKIVNFNTISPEINDSIVESFKDNIIVKSTVTTNINKK